MKTAIVLCRVTPFGGFCFMDLNSGLITFANGGFPNGSYNRIPGNGDANFGTIGWGGVYKDGVYWIMCSGSARGSVTLMALNPDSLGLVGAVVTDATGIDGLWGPRCYSAGNGDGRLMAFMRDPGVTNKLTVFGIETGVRWGHVAWAPPMSTNLGLVPAAFNASAHYLVGAGWRQGDSTIFHYVYNCASLGSLPITAGGGDISGFNNILNATGVPQTQSPGISATGDNYYLPLNAVVSISGQMVGNGAGQFSPAGDGAAIIIASDTFLVDTVAYVGFHNLNIYGDPMATFYEGLVNSRGHSLRCGFCDHSDGRVWFARNPLYYDTTPQDDPSFQAISVLTNGSPSTFQSLLGGAGTVVMSGEGLDAVVGSLCRQAGLADSQLDLTDLTSDTVDGYTIATQTTIKDAITPLQSVYYFDAVESNGILKFVKRGKALTMTIPDKDLAAHSLAPGAQTGDEQAENMLTVSRMMDAELPHTVTVQYINRATDYSSHPVRAAPRGQVPQ
jgi:hypothetical protein